MSNQTINVMLDLETTGTGPTAAIAAIGATTFYRDGTMPSPVQHFYYAVDIESAVAAGGTIDAGTFKWWMQQSAEARACFEGKATIQEALIAFSDWFKSLSDDPASIKIWANGPDFDITILAESYKRCGMTAPWSFWNVRCFRTLKAEHPGVKLKRRGIHHNALDDSRNQAEHVLAIDGATAPRNPKIYGASGNIYELRQDHGESRFVCIEPDTDPESLHDVRRTVWIAIASLYGISAAGALIYTIFLK